jgi:hypothetical protein
MTAGTAAAAMTTTSAVATTTCATAAASAGFTPMAATAMLTTPSAATMLAATAAAATSASAAATATFTAAAATMSLRDRGMQRLVVEQDEWRCSQSCASQKGDYDLTHGTCLQHDVDSFRTQTRLGSSLPRRLEHFRRTNI